MQNTLADHGIDMAIYFGGDKLQGGPCRRLMTKRKEITADWKRAVLSEQEQQKVVEERLLWDVFDSIERLLGHFDALFSIARTKRYHLATEQVEKAKIHSNKALALCRYLGLSITPNYIV